MSKEKREPTARELVEKVRVLRDEVYGFLISKGRLCKAGTLQDELEQLYREELKALDVAGRMPSA